MDMDSIEASLENIGQAVQKVEQAIKDKWTTPKLIVVLGLWFLGFSWFDDLWYSKWRYALAYGVDSSKVEISDNRTHGCAFIAAPIGEKYCHWNRVVSTLRWARSTTGSPVASLDEGKTWNYFTPDPGANVPPNNTVEKVFVSWEKEED